MFFWCRGKSKRYQARKPCPPPKEVDHGNALPKVPQKKVIDDNALPEVPDKKSLGSAEPTASDATESVRYSCTPTILSFSCFRFIKRSHYGYNIKSPLVLGMPYLPHQSEEHGFWMWSFSKSDWWTYSCLMLMLVC